MINVNIVSDRIFDGTPRNLIQAMPLEPEVAYCDWCGREVRPETASSHIQRTDDGLEVVLLCPACEFGTD